MDLQKTEIEIQHMDTKGGRGWWWAELGDGG